MQRDAVIHIIRQLLWIADGEVVPASEVCNCRLCREADSDGLRKNLRKYGRDMLRVCDVPEDTPGAGRMVAIMRIVDPILYPK